MTDAELLAFIGSEIERLERKIAHDTEMAGHDNPEVKLGGNAFLRKHSRELRIMKLAQQALQNQAERAKAGGETL